MKKFILILLTIAGLASEMYAQKRIVGGSAVDISQRPYMAEIFGRKANDPYTTFGGGVILNERWILTAAHVVDDIDINLSEVSTGNNNPDKDNNKSSIEAIYIHPNYINTMSDFDNDVALIKLSEPLVFGPNRQAIKLSQITEYPDNTIATVSGWGRTSLDSSSHPTMLQTANVVVQTYSYKELTSESSSTFPYSGDSGAPLTVSTPSGDMLIGIVSGHPEEISETVETYYTNIGYYFDWIAPYIYQCEINGPDIIGTTGEFTISPYENFEARVSGALDTVTKNGNKITVSGHGPGSGLINIYVNDRLVLNKYIWVGAPSISGVVVDGDYLRLSKGIVDQHITQTEWNIDGSYYSYYEDWIYNPYANYGNVRNKKISVTVTATNQYGKSKPYSTIVTYSKGTMYNISQIDGTNSIRISANTESDFLTTSRELTKEGTGPYYILTNIKNGTIIKRGQLPKPGGTIELNNEERGIYILKLYDNNGYKETFKITLK